MTQTGPILYKREDAAHMLGITRRTLGNMIRDGLAKETRIYGVSRIHQDEIERIAREGTSRQHVADDATHPPDTQDPVVDKGDNKSEAKEE
jgi:hypothetical protein